MAEKLFDRIRNGLKQAQAEAEARKEFKIKLACYEESYAESKSRKPELPDLESMADLKKQDPHAYADKLDALAHMRAFIDAAYEAAKKIPNFDPKSPSAGKDYGDAYVQVGMSVHDDWCINNTQKYSDPKRRDRQWQFLSSEAIGHDEFVKDLKYVDIVMKKKGYPSFMKNDYVAQDGDALTAKDHVKSAFARKQRSYEAKTPEERRNFEIDRWSLLSIEKASRAEAGYSNPSDAYHLVFALPKSSAVQASSNHILTIDDFYEWTDTKYFVGEPYEISGWDGMYTYAKDCDAVDIAMKQADDKFKPDRVKLAESSLGVVDSHANEGPDVTEGLSSLGT